MTKASEGSIMATRSL